MAAKKGFEEFEPLFGEAAAEMEAGMVTPGSGFHRPFLFYARALDPYRIDIAVTDFCSHTLERVLTVHDVEDMRDESGVGSSCSEFLDYLISSLSSDGVRLVIGGGPTGKLVARKSKGMPNISINLQKLSGLSSNDAMGNLSLTLYRELKEKCAALAKECQRRTELENSLSVEKQRSEHLEKQLDSLSFKRKVSRPKLSENSIITDVTSNSEARRPSERPAERVSPSTKIGQRAAPAFRRAKPESLNNPVNLFPPRVCPILGHEYVCIPFHVNPAAPGLLLHAPPCHHLPHTLGIRPSSSLRVHVR